MPHKARNIVEMVKQVSLRIITYKNYPFTEGTSIMKQVAVVTSEEVCLDPSVVKVGKYKREFAEASLEKDDKLFYFF